VEFDDLIYDKRDGVAVVTIDRPEKFNAFRAQTCTELIAAFRDAWADRSIGVVILTGAGDRAFCTGGDVSVRDGDGYDGAGSKSDIGLDIEEVHSIVRDIPKPVIAAVNGYAIGGGHVLHVICDMTIAAANAKFGQVGPKVGSVDPGFGTAYLARLVGEKRAREIWYLCRRYTAKEALDMGLVNCVVPHDKLDEEVDKWCAEIRERSPTAIAIAKRSFNADTEQLRGLSALGFEAVSLFYDTEESKEGGRAFREKRPPKFRP